MPVVPTLLKSLSIYYDKVRETAGTDEASRQRVFASSHALTSRTQTLRYQHEHRYLRLVFRYHLQPSRS